MDVCLFFGGPSTSWPTFSFFLLPFFLRHRLLPFSACAREEAKDGRRDDRSTTLPCFASARLNDLLGFEKEELCSLIVVL